jgi:hypothetical protein
MSHEVRGVILVTSEQSNEYAACLQSIRLVSHFILAVTF